MTDRVQLEGDGGHSHAHGVSGNADRRYLWGALIALTAFMLGEVVVAFVTGSLALLSDAGHMLSDVASIAVALWAMTLAARPAQGRWTYGFKRAEILAALANGVTLLVLGLVLAVEAIRRLITPPQVHAPPVIIVALVGIVVNFVATWLLAKANRTSLNIRGAYQHILTDLFGFIGTLLAGLVILFTGWTRADALASLVVVTLMVRAGWPLVRESGTILLEAAPPDINLDEVRTHLLDLDHVVAVHDLHVWTLTNGMPAVSAHIVTRDDCFIEGDTPELLDELQECLRTHFDIEHSTFQLEPAAHAQHEPGMHQH